MNNFGQVKKKFRQVQTLLNMLFRTKICRWFDISDPRVLFASKGAARLQNICTIDFHERCIMRKPELFVVSSKVAFIQNDALLI